MPVSSARFPFSRHFGPVLLAAGLAASLAACGPSELTAEQQAAVLAGKAGEPAVARAAEDNLAQSLIDKLAEVTDAAEAAQIEEEIWDAWMLSGSPTTDILIRRGVEAQEMNDMELARDLLDRAILVSPKFAEAWNRRALIFFKDGLYGEAIADLESTLTHEPRHFGAWISLGMIFESVSQPAPALAAYRKALAIHPNAEAAKQGERRLVRVVEGRAL